MAKIVIVSDIHVKLRRHIDFETSRFEALILALQNTKADVIIFNGDLFDAARPSLEEIRLVTKALETLSDSRVYILPGNHEAVTKRASTYDYISLPANQVLSPKVLYIEGVSIRLCPWADIHNLKDYSSEQILISHYRSAIEGLFEEEVATNQFINNYELILLGDIHYRYSPLPHAFYTGCPYPVNYTKDTGQKYGYIELDAHDKKYSWKYVDLELPKKIKLDMKFEELKAFKASAEHMYKINVSGTLDELSTLTNTSNVAYIKYIVQIATQQVEPATKIELNFVDALVENVRAHVRTTPTKIKNILNEIHEGD